MLPSSWLSYGNTTPKELTPFLNQSKLVSMEIDKSHPQAKYIEIFVICISNIYYLFLLFKFNNLFVFLLGLPWINSTKFSNYDISF